MKTREAIAVHMQWKMTLDLKIARKESLTDDHLFKIYNPQHCLLGQWLASLHTLKMRHTGAYNELDRQHTRFHREMARVAVRINAGHFGEASQLLSPDSAFQLASHHLWNAITAAGRLVEAE